MLTYAGLAQSDQIEDCIDYERTAQRLRHHAEGAARFTVEALAEDLAQICLEIPGVEKVRIRVEKPGAVRFTAFGEALKLEHKRINL